MNWQQACEHPDLKDLPFRVELNERGQIIMSPVKVIHSLYQGKIGHLLRLFLKTGEAMPECAISTRKGTKVADVAWASQDRLERIRYETECSVAPEICVEVLSDSNTEEEMEEKKQLYFENGAHEVWICTQDGGMSFHKANGETETSALVPDFPKRIEI
ncbi:MAG: hypothetical protein B6245_23030 [Desulfobacteraceae bacterium 4572_88]|nr:MAG: hypothetical protein B6245_23030 [Desulfobacteraceae bacterium 4572_88]